MVKQIIKSKRIKNIRIPWYRFAIPMITLILAIIAYTIVPSYIQFSELARKIGLGIIFIIGGWALNNIVNMLIDYRLKKHDIGQSDNFQARKVQTRMKYVKIVLNIIIFTVSIALALYQFESMRQFSTSILASAGIAGIILAFSAQTLLANIMAGFEIAFSQPIRIDDVVVVEGEWGRIEEINTTNVIVKIWDQRRLVLPITYFVQNPFQNWTKKSADIWGTAEFYVDYTMPMQPLKDELTKILNSTDLWDKKVNVFQVIDTTEKTMKIRALMSARNSGDAWDLRCLVRERIISFLQAEYPEHLPTFRTDISEKLENAKPIDESKNDRSIDQSEKSGKPTK